MKSMDCWQHLPHWVLLLPAVRLAQDECGNVNYKSQRLSAMEAILHSHEVQYECYCLATLSHEFRGLSPDTRCGVALTHQSPLLQAERWQSERPWLIWHFRGQAPKWYIHLWVQVRPTVSATHSRGTTSTG